MYNVELKTEILDFFSKKRRERNGKKYQQEQKESNFSIDNVFISDVSFDHSFFGSKHS